MLYADSLPKYGSRYAFNESNQWINASHTSKTSDAQGSFFCDCPDRHKMKLVHPSGQSDKRPFAPYFAHVSTGHKRNNNGELIQCRSGGESMEHKNAKHMLREMVGQFSFTVQACPCCGQEVVEDGQGATIQMEVKSDDGKWRYDCMLVRNGVRIAALEIFHTHATTHDKVKATRRHHGLQIAEFKAEDVASLVPGSKLNNLQVQKLMCHSCLVSSAHAFRLECLQGEQNEVLKQEAFIESEMFDQESRKKQRRLEFEMQLVDSVSTMYQQDILQQRFYDEVVMHQILSPEKPKQYYFSRFVGGAYAYYNYFSTKEPAVLTYGQLYLKRK